MSQNKPIRRCDAGEVALCVEEVSLGTSGAMPIPSMRWVITSKANRRNRVTNMRSPRFPVRQACCR
jgi:hypothetical protein